MRIVLLTILALCLAHPPVAHAATDASPVVAKRPQEEYPFPADVLRRQLIKARIFSRTGQYPRALKAYRALVKSRPDDDAVREQYIESVINNEDFALAVSLLNTWLHSEPNNTAALRLKGLVHMRTNEPRRALHYYERMVDLRPGDTDAVADSAFAHLDAGDWVTALDRFSEVLDNDPDNQAASEAIMSIIEERAPRLDIGFGLTTQTQDARITTLSLAWSQQLDDFTRLEADLTNFDIHRPEADGTPLLNKQGQAFHTRLTRTVDWNWDIIAGAGFSSTSDSTSAFSQELGFNWRPRPGHELAVLYTRSAPYSDSIDGFDRKMTYDDLTATYSMFVDDKWFISLGGTARQYSIDSGNDYAFYQAFDGSVGRRIWRNPDVFLTYSYLRSGVSYQDENNTPVTFLTNEIVHSLTASYEHIVTTLFSYTFSAGARYDEHKSYVSFFGNAGFLIKFCRRLQWQTSYGYTSDSDTGAAGVSTSVTSNIRILF